MRFSWFYGPDKSPFIVDDSGVARSEAGDPFHGIVGSGTRGAMQVRGMAPDMWVRFAHHASLYESTGAGRADLDPLRTAVSESGALSYGESASCVRLYLENHYTAAQQIDGVEVWGIKEGHTSSVWRVKIRDSSTVVDEFIVNVARDLLASTELQRTSEQIRQINQCLPETNVAAVNDIQTVRLSRDGEPLEVVVTQNEWVSDSTEIHNVPTGARPNHRYALVERFLTSESAPAQVVSIYGRWCTDDERRQIDSDVSRFGRSAATVLPTPAEVNLNHGDVVWNGHEAIVVAIS